MFLAASAVIFFSASARSSAASAWVASTGAEEAIEICSRAIENRFKRHGQLSPSRRRAERGRLRGGSGVKKMVGHREMATAWLRCLSNKVLGTEYLVLVSANFARVLSRGVNGHGDGARYAVAACSGGHGGVNSARYGYNRDMEFTAEDDDRTRTAATRRKSFFLLAAIGTLVAVVAVTTVMLVARARRAAMTSTELIPLQRLVDDHQREYNLAKALFDADTRGGESYKVSGWQARLELAKADLAERLGDDQARIRALTAALRDAYEYWGDVHTNMGGPPPYGNRPEGIAVAALVLKIELQLAELAPDAIKSVQTEVFSKWRGR